MDNVKKKDKDGILLKQKYNKTLGQRMLTFAQRKMASTIEGLQQMSNEKNLTEKYKLFGKGFLPHNRQPLNRVIDKNDLIYIHYPVMSTFENMLTKKRQLESDKGTALPSGILRRFSRWLDIKLPSVYIHQNDMSNKLLRERNADAMTVGSDIYFKTGKFDLRNVRNLGLLGHELTHVAQQNTSDWHNTGLNTASERSESSAIDNEKFIMRNADIVGLRNELISDIGSLPLTTTPTTPSGTDSVTPMFAESTRNINESPGNPLSALNSMVISESEMMRIKNEVYQDLMMRIKVEFERGA